ncbi:MAG: NAD(P)-dependent oxidoreductase [Sciscionella sp.]|nr:NAD(P)-dependent oxidoreductase [Sciscionella sp.]
MNTVLITGAAGHIGRTLCAGLAEKGWRIRGIDLVEMPPEIDGRIADLASADSARTLAEMLDGCDALIHLAAVPEEDKWPKILTANIDATHRVLESARLAGVRRVVYASSNHATGYTPRGGDPLPANAFPRPDTFYGVSKVASEALCSLYADRHGMRVVALRIGTFAPVPPDERALATWLSPADMVALTHAALTANIDGFRIVWGISDNSRAWWSPAAGESMGYHPRDDAEKFADNVLPSTPEELAKVGGPFTLPKPGDGVRE